MIAGSAIADVGVLEIQLQSFPRASVIWFADKAASPSDIPRLTTSVLRFKQARQKPSEGVENYSEVFPYETLLTDLTADQDRLWGAISPATRNYINSATAKLAYEVTYFERNPPARCYDFLARFAAEKGFWTPTPPFYEKHVAHCTVACGLLDGEMTVLHFYLHDRETKRVHLLWSVRSLTGTDRAHQRAVSSLNKLLHWQDLLHFKNDRGFATFDWGGLSRGNPALRGVDSFKRQFGGIPVTEWEVTWRSPFYAPLRKFVRSIAQTPARGRLSAAR